MDLFNKRQLNRIEETLDRMEGKMSQISDAVDNLKKEVGETLTSVQAKIDELRALVQAGGTPQAVIDSINEASTQLDALQQTLAVPEP